MSLRRCLSAFLTLLFLASCAAPTPVPLPTAGPISQAPREIEPPTAIFATPTAGIEIRTINCASSDGVPLATTLYGQGNTVIIFSNRSDQGRASWAALAQRAAAAGYLAVTFDYRAFEPNGNVDIAKLNLVNLDLRGVVSCVKLLGTHSVVLVGASIGGIASAKEAAAAHPAALIIVGSPMSHPDLTIRVEAAELQSAVPKLFIASEKDTLVAAGDTRAMFDAAAEPKTFYQYPGDAHGTDLLLGSNAQDFSQRVMDFVAAHAPANR